MRFSLLTIFLLIGFAISVGAQIDSAKTIRDSTKFANDTIKEYDDTPQKSVVLRDPEHSPKKAGMLSAILPGLGQVYNHKYWKVPLVIGALGGVGYWAYLNTIDYNFYHDGLIVANKHYNDTTNLVADLFNYAKNTKYTSVMTADQLTPSYISHQKESYFQDQSDYYRRYRDLSFFCVGLLYLLNVLDATVDGHLYNYNVDDNLSFHIQPTVFSAGINNPATMGLLFKMKF